MKAFLRVIIVVAVFAVIGLALFILVPVQTTGPQQAVAGDWEPAEGEGYYAMRLADCAACHTAEDGVQFAGGRPIESPVGTVYSSNITPDPETGIGNYTLDEFRAALYDGIRQDGAHLYPAMPYDNYRLISETDVRALYSYFKEEVAPVQNIVPDNDLPFPFDQRWGLRAWNWINLPDPGFQPMFDDEQLNRGAYIVEGPGHCGACHSPRNAVFGQNGFTAHDAPFLTGGEIAGWTAPDLRGPDSPPQRWDGEQLARILATGRNAHASIVGEMALVVEDSLQYLTPDDLAAVVAYLRHIGNDGPADDASEDGKAVAEDPGATKFDMLVASETSAMLTSANPEMALGARLYLDNCNACHFVDGLGASEVFPELDGNHLVNADQPTGLIHMIMFGDTLPSTGMRPMRLQMPGFAHRLSDEEVAELATFVRSAWSNTAGAVSADNVAEMRDNGSLSLAGDIAAQAGQFVTEEKN
ncbi:cytochrome c [Pseudotabrizicola alkalilacus]|uniref:Cytochrome c n=1 Tax=Pseudotabrizicola alkalilacus TaxID=2305252 RepID=A0A411YX67_9RHOB|nr:c-type cytochrome [Pseudotabrizicola alkalilacus]RGP35378.1 cytochrome c [Pseudotabrizicola alkalilacus]